jgi:transposase-like protein
MGEKQMQKAKYTDEFKEKAVHQVIDRGYYVIDVVKRQGIGVGLVDTWVKKLKVANE